MTATSAAPAPMEARLAETLPIGPGWQYEPKWDGFRAIAHRNGDLIDLISKSGKPLGRYFPDIVAMLRALDAAGFTIDGELVIPIGDQLSFAALQARLHPAASRVTRLAAETPALYILFDCLALKGETLADAPLVRRREALERFHAHAGSRALILSPVTTEADVAGQWLRGAGRALDGVVAKRLDEPYRSGERAMIKVKQLRTADCVIGGFRETATGQVASLLLGLYNDAGRLDHVGFTAAFSAEERRALGPTLRRHRGGEGFTGDRPGGPSRWSRGEQRPWIPLEPKLVAEVVYDQVTDGRFRHGARFLRWRPDKDPAQCTRDQLARALRPSDLADLAAIPGASQ